MFRKKAEEHFQAAAMSRLRAKRCGTAAAHGSDILDIFGDGNLANTTAFRNDLVQRLKNDILDEVEAVLSFQSHGRPFPKGPFDLVSEAINDGWNELADDTSSLMESLDLYPLKLNENLISTSKQYDWFSLVCGFFNEEYKTNPRVTAAMHKYLLLEIRDQQGNPIRTDQAVGAELVFGYLQQFNYAFVRLETWIQKADTTQDEILRYVKGLIRIETKVDFIVEKTTRMQRDLEAIRNRQSELLAVGV